MDRALVWVGHCGGVTCIPEQELHDFHAGQRLVATFAATVLLVGIICTRFF